MAVSSSQRVLTDTRVKATWEEFVEIAYDPAYTDCKTYFDSGSMRIEMPMEDERSGQIRTSGVLPGLEMDLIEEALRRSQTENDGAITQWLMKTFASDQN